MENGLVIVANRRPRDLAPMTNMCEINGASHLKASQQAGHSIYSGNNNAEMIFTADSSCYVEVATCL